MHPESDAHQNDLFGDLPIPADAPAPKPARARTRTAETDADRVDDRDEVIDAAGDDDDESADGDASGASGDGAGSGKVKQGRRAGIQPQPADDELLALAERLSPRVWLGTSSWSYPGWQGSVWAGRHGESNLARNGLSAYARHPLLRAVSIDRGFYQSLTASQYERYAQQVPEDFRFTVKAPALVTDAQVRSEDGRGKQANTAFLDPRLAIQEFVAPALEGLGARIGALVFQLSPLPLAMLDRMPEQLDRLHAMLAALPSLRDVAPEAVVAVEVRDPEWLTPDFVAVLKDTGARYCLGLHPKLPTIQEQLPLLRAMWPGPLVCRWNLHRLHGPFGYEDAERKYGEYAEVLDPDPETRAVLAKVIRATAEAGHPAYVTVSNHAEGSAPLSVRALAREIVDPGAA
ncbi:MAG: DUF72 domain-containing protein [Mitsuaria chitosanitabida]|uniref:DUF72 domain-containing protein n=1 Tax=Roseateles chitosanitabidus TaxID=65048 RepID=UPI001B060738|nr:DUF72 domain-containing protein [Roseateles chitosanitabidus]MBO9685003.1 DUF72 domain-containing protein [Roseateles chitosanitabidus]